MNKLSIESLIQNNVKISKVSGGLDVYSLINTKSSYDDIHTYNADILIKSRLDKREKKLNTFLRHYGRCFENIKMLNNSNKTDAIFAVPDIEPDCHGYHPTECVEFIENKLKEKFMNIYRMNYKTIFITWKYIEFNKEFNK
jgi:hypothetical protein